MQNIEIINNLFQCYIQDSIKTRLEIWCIIYLKEKFHKLVVK